MSLYLADEFGHLADVGSASRYAKFLDWADQSNDAAVRQFADHGSTTQVDALAKACEAAKGSRSSLIKLIADAARVAVGVLTIQDGEQEMEIRALWPDATGYDDHGRDPSEHEYTHEQAQEALENYTEGASNEVNDGLRAGDVTMINDPHVKAMDQLMKPLGFSRKLYRINDDPKLDSLKPGDVYKDNGYTSTTTDKGALSEIATDTGMSGDNYTTLKIYAKGSIRGVDVNKTVKTSYNYQKEVVLARGTHYKVLSRTAKEIVMEAQQ